MCPKDVEGMAANSVAAVYAHAYLVQNLAFLSYLLPQQKNRYGGYLMIIKGSFSLFLHKNICCGTH